MLVSCGPQSHAIRGIGEDPIVTWGGPLKPTSLKGLRQSWVIPAQPVANEYALDHSVEEIDILIFIWLNVTWSV